MWFVFGLITLISFCSYNIYKKLNASWDGISEETKGTKYQYKLKMDDDEIQEVLVGIDCPSSFDFSLKREGTMDRLFKKIGLAREHQIGNKEFDDLVYVLSDHSVLHDHITDNSKIVEDVLALFSSRSGFGVNVREVRCHSGRIWLRYQAPLGFNEEKVPKLASALVPLLKSVSTELQTADLPQGKKWKDPFVIKASVILAISSGILFNGLAQTFRLHYQNVPFTIDTQPLLFDAFVWGLGLIAILITLALIILGRSSRTHLVLIELLFIGSIGSALTAHAQLRDLNMEMDTANGAKFVVYTHRKKVVSGRRSTSYYLYVDDWTEEDDVKKIEVSSDFYSKVYRGNELLISERPGYLGYRWVADIRKL